MTKRGKRYTKNIHFSSYRSNQCSSDGSRGYEIVGKLDSTVSIPWTHKSISNYILGGQESTVNTSSTIIKHCINRKMDQ